MRADGARRIRFRACVRRRGQLVFVALSIAVAGCATFAKTGIALDDPMKRAALIQSVERRYPERFRAIHRARLTFRGRDFALDGYLRIDGDQYRFLASTGFGTALFEMASARGGGDVVLRNEDLMPREILLAGPARDLRASYLQTPTPLAALSVLPDGRMTLTDSGPDGSRTIFTFDAATERWLTYRVVDRGRTQRVLRFDDYTDPDEGGYSFPRRIHISNPAQHYTVDVRVASVQPEP